MKKDKVWLDGFYSPNLDDYSCFNEWLEQWSYTEEHWIWFEPGYYTIDSIIFTLAEKKVSG